MEKLKNKKVRGHAAEDISEANHMNKPQNLLRKLYVCMCVYLFRGVPEIILYD